MKIIIGLLLAVVVMLICKEINVPEFLSGVLSISAMWIIVVIGNELDRT